MKIRAVLTCCIFFLASLPIYPQEVIRARRRVVGGGGGAKAFVQGKQCRPTTNPFNCAFTSNVGSGNSVTVYVGWQYGAGITISTVADGDSNSYSNTAWATGASNCHAGNGDVRVYTRFNITNADAGTKTITVGFSSSPSFTTVITIIENNGGATAVDKADCQSTIGTTAPASPSVTTTSMDFVSSFSFDVNENNRTWTAGTSPAYTGFDIGTTLAYQEYVNSIAAGAMTGNFTVNTSDTFNTGIVALK